MPKQAREYAEAVRSYAHGVFSEQPPPFSGLNVEGAGDFPKLDANYLHGVSVASERLCPLRKHASHRDREELVRLLAQIYESEDVHGRRRGRPPMFYALLLADGDHLGEFGSTSGRSGREPRAGAIHQRGIADRNEARWGDRIRWRRRRTGDASRTNGPDLCSRPLQRV